MASVFASVMEAMSIGALLPFIGILIEPNSIFHNQIFFSILEILGQSSSKSDVLLTITIVFCLLAFFSGALRIGVLYFSTLLSFQLGKELVLGVYRKILYQPYEVHLMRNSSEIIGAISVKSNMLIFNAILPFISICTSSVMLVMVLVTLFLINSKIASAVFFGIGGLYLIIHFITSEKFRLNSVVVSKSSNQIIQIVQESLGGIRDVLIDRTQEIYCREYAERYSKFVEASASNQMLQGSPRYVVETILIILIALFAFIFSKNQSSLIGFLPVMATLGLAAQRILPLLQQIYGSWSSIKGGDSSLKEMIGYLELKIPVDNKNILNLQFTEAIEIKNLSFSHKLNKKSILKNLNFKIHKGERVGIVGPTGCGKSTLLDIFMGLLSPTGGSVLIDGIELSQANINAWKTNVAHVPQLIYLSDSSIAENIAFGVPVNEINWIRLEDVAKKAQLYEFIMSNPGGFRALVGERGCRLSGGQRQRLGIARALYKNASCIIFDEATSALDVNTELAIVDGIQSLSRDLTIIMVAHRLSALKGCDYIVDMGEEIPQKITHNVFIGH
nr:ABC transporter ATP-binding protein [Polynucleobacter sp. es-GGE-1]